MKLKLTKKGFNAFADKDRDVTDIHDRVHDAYEGKLGEKFKEKTRKRVDWVVESVSGKTVLDVGCSQGTVPILLGRKGVNVLGVDIDGSAVKDANKLLSNEPSAVKDLVSFQEEDFLKYEFKDKKFDSIIFSELLEHLLNPEDFVKRAFELTVPGGRLIVTVPFGINDHPDHRQVFYTGELYLLISKYFNVKEIKIFGKWVGVVGERKKVVKPETSVSKKYVDQNEEYFYQIERALEESNKKLKQQKINITLEKKLSEDRVRTLTFTNRKILNELNAIKTSKGFRINALIGQALRRPRRFVLLPYRILKVITTKPLTASAYIRDLIRVPTIKVRKQIEQFKLKSPHAVKKKELRVASILDDFSYSSFSPECNLLQLKVGSWKVEMDDFEPEMLFVESAWRGFEGEWEGLVSNMSKDLELVLQYCRERGIPTVFWCKEDPVHFEKFIETAKYFDYIFTSDIDSVERYKRIVGHNRVESLRFAAQPSIMNPIEKYDRKDAVCFAGTYYVKYEHRAKEFEEIIDELLKNDFDVEIYDRNFNRGDPNYFYPDKYQKLIKGTLSFNEIDKAYKGYKYALTMNTIQNSKTMFARRAFELLASNTITISNNCLGIKTQLGDLVISSDNGEKIVKRLQKITANETDARKFKLMGLREVMNHHTYDVRLSEICSEVFTNYTPSEEIPLISVMAKTDTQKDLDYIVNTFENQSYSNKILFVIAPKKVKVPKHVHKITSSELVKNMEGVGDYFTILNTDDFYGNNFLLDLMLATKYSNKPVIGKASYYQVDNKKLELKNDGRQYRENETVEPQACIFRASEFENEKLSSLIDAKVNINESETLAVDEFNYCKYGRDVDSELTQIIVGTIEELDTGSGS